MSRSEIQRKTAEGSIHFCVFDESYAGSPTIIRFAHSVEDDG